MRKTTLYGKDDGLVVNLGSNVDIICAVMEVGIGRDFITYEVEYTGVQLIEFFDKYNFRKIVQNELNFDLIIEDNRYVLTAYDW